MDKFENYDISMLIRECRNHSDAAFSELVRRYTPMMNKVVSGFVDLRASYDELFTEATVALHSAMLKYDLEQQGVTFGLFARICVYHRLVDSLRKEESEPELISIDAEEISDHDEIEQGIVTRETVSCLLKSAERLLSDYEFRVLMLHIQGYKTAAIAEMLGKTPKSVDNAKSRLFKRLRCELGSEIGH